MLATPTQLQTQVILAVTRATTSLMTRINGIYFASSNLSCTYQVPLTEETQKLTSFFLGGRQYTYQV